MEAGFVAMPSGIARQPDPGLCRDCRHSRRIESDRGSVFFRCDLSLKNPAFPKYPRLPVRECSGYQPIKAAEPLPE
jgi:hypothetical protein